MRATFDRVRAGQPLAELYVPDWVAAQEEYLAGARACAGQTSMRCAMRRAQRLRLAGMGEAQIARVVRRGPVHAAHHAAPRPSAAWSAN